MNGIPRKRAPDDAGADREPGATAHWTEIADAVYLAAARARASVPPAPAAPPAPPGAGEDAGDGEPEEARSGAGPSEDDERRQPVPEYRDLPAGDPGLLLLAEAPGRADGPGSTAAVPGTPAGDRGRGEGATARQSATRLQLARALHLLSRRVPTRNRAVLDEDLTAEHGLADNLWIPHLRPAQEKALDIALLVDASPSMRLWKDHAAAVAVEAARSGAFRDVRVVGLELTPKDGLSLRWPGGRRGAPGELLDGRGTRVHLLVTDGLSHGWTTPDADRLLDRLARSGPTAVAHLLPTYLWHRTSVHPWRGDLGSGGFAVPNDHLVRPPASGVAGATELEPAPQGVPVPVLSLKAESFTTWAEVVSGEPGLERRLPFVVAGSLAAGKPTRGLHPPRREGGAAEAAVRRFLSLASPLARRLAQHAAALPLDFDLIDEVRHRVPELHQAGPEHMAEVLMGGLVDWDGPDGSGTPDFAEGVREALLATGTRSQVARMINLYASLPGSGAHGEALREALRDPAGAAFRSADPSFVRLEVALLKALSGPYARRAVRVLAGVTARHGDTDDPAHENHESSDTPTPRGGAFVTTDTTQPPATESQKVPPMETRVAPPPYSRSSQPKVLGNVPPKNPNFIGREALLAAVEAQLRDEETTAVLPHTLHGMGGVGKSQLAVEYVYRHSHEYNVVWWIPSERESLVLGALVDLAVALKLDVPRQANVAVPAVREALRTGEPYGNWLLVFDNAEDIEAVRSYFPVGGPGKIIVTSRNREWERVAHPLTVDVFEREESIALLQRRARGLSTEDAGRLAEALGDLPLAVEQAGAWHAATGMPVSEYLTLLVERTPGILDLAPTADYPVSVAAAWNISLDRLSQDHPAARQLLEICACMAPEPISISMLRTSRNIEITPELDPVLRDPVLLARATRELSKLSLVKIDHKSGTLQMHRLMQTVVGGNLDDETRTLLRNAAHVLLANAKPGSPSSSDQWPAYQQLLPHILASGAVHSPDRWVRELVNETVLYLYYWGAHDTGATMAGDAYTAWTAQSGEDDPQVLRAGKLLAFMLRQVGRHPEAHEINQSILDLSRRAAVSEEDLIDSMTQMAGSLRYMGDFRAALALDEEADNRARDLFGPEEPATLEAAHSLGVSLRSCGEFVRARDLDTETARLWDSVYGPTNSLTLNTLNGLAIDIREAGDYPAARVMQEETYRLLSSVFGQDNAATIRAARNLAVCLRKDGSLQEAAQLSEDTLERFTLRYGPDLPDTLAAAANAAVDRRLLGDFGASRELGEQTLARFRSTLGPLHAYTLVTMTNHAATQRALGDLEAAEILDSEAAKGFTETLGGSHLFTLTACMGLANSHYAQLDFRKAREIDARTLDLLVEASGPQHPVTLSCRANLALDLRGLGEVREADRLNAEAVEGLMQVVGADHPWLTQARLHQRIECDLAPTPL
ncbi:FxSxx-COOH system tetratricopeptide repeat protein [Streptomyces sp. NPDC056600]|uniref:FxSxx-COOH system tetratricopeptide repeat protein n=1 Tax=Streptomyces sp. NPDC056600 TaxID=3345874 RepID=UPI00367AAA1C